MKCVIRHVIIAALLSLAFAAPASAQYMYLDTNGDGVNTSADRLLALGTATTVNVWVNTNHNRDGSLAVCNTADGDLGTWNSYAVNLQASGGAVTFGTPVNQQPAMTIPSTPFGANSTEMKFGMATGTPGTGGLQRMFTIPVTVTSGAPRLDFIAFGLLGPDPTSFGTPCSGNDFDNTYKMGSDWFDNDGAGPPLGGNANPVLTFPATVTGAEGTPMSITASATDPDAGQLVTLTQTNNAAFLAGPASAGPSANPSITLNGTPSFTQAGTYTINWTATDNGTPTAGSTTGTTTVTVNGTDRAPAVTAPATAGGTEGTLITFTVSAADPDGDNILALSAAPLPTNATFTKNAANTSGTFNFTPASGQAGTYNVTFTATNSLTGQATTTITVAAGDRAPVVTAPAGVAAAEGSPMSFTVTAADPDGQAITNLTATGTAITAGAVFTKNAANTSGTLSWTPGFTQAGSYSATFTASNALSGSATTTITVSDTDRAPVVTAPATAGGAENTPISFVVTAADPDGNAINSLTGAPLPAGAIFTANATNTSGTFSWTPGFTQAGSYSVTFTASNGLSGTATTNITVTNSDRAPVVTAPATATVAEGSPLTINVTAADPDGDAITNLTATNTAITAGAVFTKNAANTSGTLSWTPNNTQAGTYSATFTASNAVSGSAATTITVTNVDRAPVVTAPATATVAEGSPLSVVVTAADPDGEAIANLTASGTALAAGATFTANASNTSGTLSWTPNFTQAGSYSATFTATNALTGTATTAITVTNTDRAPVVTAPANQSTPSNTLLTFTVTASDPDGQAITNLTAAPLPAGATFTANASFTSGTFNWTPTNAQTGTFNVTFTASNALSGTATTQITVTSGDRAPVVTAPATATVAEGSPLTVLVSAADPDGDAITNLTATGTAITAGAVFTKNAANTSGTLSWTPGFTQAGTYSATFTATNALTGSATTTITVTNTDRAPAVTAPPTVSGASNTLITFTVTAADPDGQAITSLTAAPLPAGATFTANASFTSGTFNWTPTNAQTGTFNVTFTAQNALSGTATTQITVTSGDRAPVVTAPATATVAEGSPLTVLVTAADPDGEAITNLTATGTAITAGAVFTKNAANTSGTLSWTPGFTQSGSYSVTFTASNALSGSATTAITVTNTDRAPVVTAPATATVAEGSPLSVVVTAADPDGDAITNLTATGTAITAGAVFTKNAANTSGTLSWTPNFTQAGSYSVTFTASNALSGTATTAITVTNTDRNPVVTAPPTISGATNSPITFTVTASDPDGQAITSLTAAPLPAGATFTANATFTSGTFNWTPTNAQTGTFNVTFTASNALSGTATTQITVTSGDRAPVVTAPSTVSGAENTLITFTVTAADPDGDPITNLTATGTAITAGGTFTKNAANTSGTFSWTPTFAQAGSYSVTFTATNALSGSATTAITVTNSDRAPVATAPATATVAEGSPLTVLVTAADPDGDAITNLTATGTAITAGATFTKNAANTSGTLSWTPGFSAAGSYSVTFTASNALSGTATTAITVTNTDRAPVVSAPPTATGTVGAAMSFTVTASDPDGDAITSLTASGTAITAGGTFTANASNTSGTFSWTPAAGQQGSYSVTFTASNALSGTATTNITISAADRAPVVTAPSTVSGAENTLITYTVTASDPDGDTITSLTAGPLPAGATFTSNAAHTSGTFSWTPSYSQAGTYSVTTVASNALSGSATTSITVTNVDRPPVADAGGPYTGITNVAVNFDGSGSSDPDGDALTYAWDFGDGTTGSGATTSHTYTTAGTYAVSLTVTSGTPTLSDSDATTATISDTFPARVFTVGGHGKTSLAAGKPYTCVQIEPVSGNFNNTDVIIASIRMVYPVGSSNQILADAAKSAVDGDKDANGINEIAACFRKTDLRVLFAGLPAGSNTVTVEVKGNLVTGGDFSGNVTMTVKSNGAFAARITPNPLNPQAKLSFMTTKPGAIRVQMFDPQGRLVKTIANEGSAVAGYHDYTIDGRTPAGSKLASGVYFVKIWSEHDGDDVLRITIMK